MIQLLRFWLLAACLFRPASVQAQAPPDTIMPPLGISEDKRLSDEDLRNKPEGAYFAGLPQLSVDPLSGFGYGIQGSVFFNGRRTDPFFAYTPYRARLSTFLFNSTRAERKAQVALDAPYIFGSAWRLRVEATVGVNPNMLFFGVSEQSLQPLSYHPYGDSSQPMVEDVRFNDYKSSLPDGYETYHDWVAEEWNFNATAERSFFGGRMRILGGYELVYVDARTFAGPGLLARQAAAGEVLGMGKGWISMFQAGVIYDTRDLEPDPSKGIFAEFTREQALYAIGSSFSFSKTFLHAKVYQRVLPHMFGKAVLAARAGIGYTGGTSPPFYELLDMWGSEGSVYALGGEGTLRGFKQGRFAAPWLGFANLELRVRFTQFKAFKQHFAVGAVPFADVGAVGDDLDGVFTVGNFRFAQGLGLRLAYNVTTVLRLDWAFSEEDSQVFLRLGHSF